MLQEFISILKLVAISLVFSFLFGLGIVGLMHLIGPWLAGF